ncbi:hypothetical protein BBAD15_g9803 [Beauveria bassiana D1-5]|uniref:Uncharacterized protein n=1 Tax=Beauveria bassiana D1-5 TaxID=1245745 RepID=A0A0A2VF13_BEABA|nr:hypothetical protein BBAD15_g9803 [Beauveria bassiana D1-5]
MSHGARRKTEKLSVVLLGSYGVNEVGYADYMTYEDGTSLMEHAGDSVKIFPSTSYSGESAESCFGVVQQTSFQVSPSNSDSSGSNSMGKSFSSSSSSSSSSKLPKNYAKIHAKIDGMVKSSPKSMTLA